MPAIAHQNKILGNGALVDDTTTSADKTWSSSKINTELGLKANSADVPTKAQISNPNLLDNPWFTINQRGATTFTNAYGVDRWKVQNSHMTANVVTGGLTLSHDGSGSWVQIEQKVNEDDAKLLDGKTLTLSIMVDGVVYSKSGVYTYANNEAVLTTSFNNGQWRIELRNIPTNSKRLVIRCGSESASSFTTGTIRAIKLELGSISTLALDTAPNYATELLKCQRYFVRLATTNAFMGYMHSSSVARIILPTPVTMRTRPTWTPSDVTGLQIVSGTTTQTLSNSQALSWAGFTPQEFVIAISDLTSPFISGEFCMMKLNTSYIDLSADL